MKHAVSGCMIILLGLTLAGCVSQAHRLAPDIPLSDSKEIVSFGFNDPAATGSIDAGLRAISVTVPYGTDVTSLSPVILHTGINVIPPFGTMADFSKPLIFTVIAADRSSQTYTVTVLISPKPAASRP